MVKVSKMKKSAHTDTLLQEILKSDVELMDALEDAADEIASTTESSYMAAGHPEVNAKVDIDGSNKRLKANVILETDDGDHPIWLEAQYGFLAKASKQAQAAHRSSGKKTTGGAS